MVEGKYVQQNAEPSSSEPVAPPRKMDDAFVTDELAKNRKKDNELDDDYRLAGSLRFVHAAGCWLEPPGPARSSNRGTSYAVSALS